MEFRKTRYMFMLLRQQIGIFVESFTCNVTEVTTASEF